MAAATETEAVEGIRAAQRDDVDVIAQYNVDMAQVCQGLQKGLNRAQAQHFLHLL